MRKIVNENFKETYYIKQLDNGLKVILFEKPAFHSHFFTLITPYGASDYQQKDEAGNTYHLPPGVAHFLEHRMFDYQGFDVMERFTELGSTSNASTGFDQTQYYFATTNEEYRKSLSLLLDFVFDLTIPAETVEKEKGIIIEELMMYDGMPDFKLYFSTLKAMYHNLPYKEDIGGSVESVSETTLADLELAYQLNYHPSQMFLVGATNDKIEDVFAFIEDNMKDKEFAAYKKLERDYEDEPLSVKEEYVEIAMDLNKQKVALGYKFKHDETDPLILDQMGNLLDIYLDMLFSSVNPDYQEWLDKQVINDYFDADISVDPHFGHLFISGESDDAKGFREFVETVFENQEQYMSEEKFKQLQHKFVGRAIMALEQPSTIAQVYGRNIANGVDVFDSVDALKAATFEDLVSLVKDLKILEHCSTVVLK